jgi:anti-sigma factor (TIGR02949 family)
MGNSSCDHAVEYLYQYIDEELTYFQASRIRLHLRRCPPCLDAYDFEARLKQVIRERGRTEPRPELFEAIRALIRQERAASGGEPTGLPTDS